MSYVYILSRQKLVKNGKRVDLGKFWKPKDFGQTVLPDKSLFIRKKVVENAKVEKIEMRHFQ